MVETLRSAPHAAAGSVLGIGVAQRSVDAVSIGKHPANGLHVRSFLFHDYLPPFDSCHLSFDSYYYSDFI